MISKDFYKKYIKSKQHIIGGSIAISKQIENFREPSDLDIMIIFQFFDELRDICKDNDYKLETSRYSDEAIITIKFSDESKIDLMILSVPQYNDYKENKTIKINNTFFLKVNEIIKHKIKLIEKCIENKKFNEHNKHLKDIININNKPIKIKDIDDIENKETKINELPF